MKFYMFIFFYILCTTSLFAKNDIMYFSLDFLQDSEAKEILDPSIELVFGSGNQGTIITKQVQSNRKTNGVGKKHQKACEWALLSALKSMQARAKKDGGTKVINITGFYYKNPFDSKTEFQCGVGNVVVGVTIRGDIAK